MTERENNGESDFEAPPSCDWGQLMCGGQGRCTSVGTIRKEIEYVRTGLSEVQTLQGLVSRTNCAHPDAREAKKEASSL